MKRRWHPQPPELGDSARHPPAPLLILKATLGTSLVVQWLPSQHRELEPHMLQLRVCLLQLRIPCVVTQTEDPVCCN